MHATEIICIKTLCLTFLIHILPRGILQIMVDWIEVQKVGNCIFRGRMNMNGEIWGPLTQIRFTMKNLVSLCAIRDQCLAVFIYQVRFI